MGDVGDAKERHELIMAEYTLACLKDVLEMYEKNLRYYKSTELVEIKEMLCRLIEKIEKVLKEL